MKLPNITSVAELEQLIEEIGFLPFFHSSIPGFSLEECTPKDYWFADGVDGPWQWRESIAPKGQIAYGKLFDKKAGFISMKWYPHFTNYRRDGYDFDVRYEEGLASRRSKIIMDLLAQSESLLSSQLKSLGGFGKNGEKGFDSAITTLQMQTYVAVKQFDYKLDKYGKPYGWGIGRYALSEAVYGIELVESEYCIKPADSFKRLAEHLSHLCPNASDKQIHSMLK